jgi:hypothetical protein
MCLAIDNTVCFLMETGPCQPTVIQPEAGIDLPPFLEKQNALTASASLFSTVFIKSPRRCYAVPHTTNDRAAQPMVLTDEEIRSWIDSTTDLEKCEKMANNIRKQRGEGSELYLHATKRIIQLRKNDAELSERRPDIDYHILGLKNGDEIYLPETDVVASIFSHRTLSYKGREVYISALEDELIEHLPRRLVVAKWRTRNTNENLNDLYNKAFPKENYN